MKFVGKNGTCEVRKAAEKLRYNSDNKYIVFNVGDDAGEDFVTAELEFMDDEGIWALVCVAVDAIEENGGIEIVGELVKLCNENINDDHMVIVWDYLRERLG